MIEEYFKELELIKERECLIAWRDFYLQGQITWEELQAAIKQRDEGLIDKIELPIVNTFAAIRTGYKIEKINQKIQRLG